ncbi:RHS repeat-associated core domain-containing protein [Methylobacterium sp. Leaf102]|uniref:RHS repeat-associated core domain-containing protein n=1 Tax=Methylobacterium sp. Leaf102 TaxID=1736253 RepID=UPI0012E90C85|nr:RHS repeat-associated core domain-containing protein [Methylobacterium sp. Leaf102]
MAEEAPLRLDGSVAWNEATGWHYEPGSFRPLAKEATDGALSYIVTDHLGTPRELLGEGGDLLWAAEYRTWGAVRRLWVAQADNDNAARAHNWSPSSSGDDPPSGWFSLALKDDPEAIDALQICLIRFQGQWEDGETGLSYNRFRHYEAALGQYASPDPIGILGGTRQQGYVSHPTA